MGARRHSAVATAGAASMGQLGIPAACPWGQGFPPEGLILSCRPQLIPFSALSAVKQTSRRLVRRHANATNADKHQSPNL